MSRVYNEVQPTLKRKRGGRGRAVSHVNNNNSTPSSSDLSDSSERIVSTNTSSDNNNNANPDWPPSLSQYVTKCFTRSSELSESDKVIFNRQLQKVIELAVDNNLIWTNDWNNQKLPILDGSNIPLQLENIRRESSRQEKKQDVQQPRIERKTSIKVKQEVMERTTSLGGAGGDFDSNERKRQRSERFTNTNNNFSATPISRTSSVVGRSTDLEKSYLRLTSEPDAAKVRNQQVLQKSLKFIHEKYVTTKNYSYVLDQFRSIRQDLMVQNIKNDFTIVVYETNAKISLENDDLGQFNQCQSQLKHLYHLTRKNNATFVKRFFRLEVEFLMYHIVYMMITFNTSEIFRIKLEILQQFKHFKTTNREIILFKFIQALFQCQIYMITGNYLRFFDSLNKFRHEQNIELAMSVLKKHLFGKFRIKSMSIIGQSFRNYPVELLTQSLAFEDYNECMEFIDSLGLKPFIQKVNDNEELQLHKCKHLIMEIVQKSKFNKVDIKGQV
ncbi:hypothetical protein JA1_002127 [Spathaspora sp. JA1]|nr:hypothetical protein JA1_002127 [Spathaspora sp. JA1]